MITCFNAFAVKPHLAATQELIDMALGNRLQAFDQEIIDALAIAVLRNRFFNYRA